MLVSFSGHRAESSLALSPILAELGEQGTGMCLFLRLGDRGDRVVVSGHVCGGDHRLTVGLGQS